MRSSATPGRRLEAPEPAWPTGAPSNTNWGKAQLQIDAARSFGRTTLGHADEQCIARTGLTGPEEQQVVAMLAYSTESAVNAVSHLFHFAGAGAIFNDNVLQRCFRDAHGSAQHLVASNAAYDQYGQRLLESAE